MAMVELAKFFELTSDLMGIVSLEGCFQSVNAAFEQVLGYRPDQMRDRPLLDLIHPFDQTNSQAQITQLLEKRAATVRFTSRCLCQNGKWRQIEWTISIADDVMYCVGHDVTNRMDNLARYKLLAEHATDIISRQTIEGDYLYISPACYEVLGYYPNELIGRNRYDFIHPEDVAQVRETIGRIDQQPETFSLVFRARHRTGHYLWMEAIQRKLYITEDFDEYRITKNIPSSLLEVPIDTHQQTAFDQTAYHQSDRPPSKAVSEIIVVARDITKRVLAQKQVQQLNAELEGRVARRTQELEASKKQYLELLKIEREGYARAELAQATAELYAEAVENMQVGLYIWRLIDAEDPTSLTLVATNPAASRLTGIPVEGNDIIGQRILDVFPGLANTDILATYAGVVRTKMMVDLGDISYTDDRVKPSIFSVKAFPLAQDCVGVSFDNVTGRREAEAVRMDQAAQLRILFDQSAVGIGRVSLKGEWIQVNQRLCDMLGYSISELLGKNYRTITHSEDLGVSQKTYERLISQKLPQVSYEKRYLTRTGDVLWASVTVSASHQASVQASNLYPSNVSNNTENIGDSADQRAGYLIVTIQDITQRKQAITALKQQKNNLMTVNMRLTNTMSQLEQRNNELDQFAYVTSHDLKAPLRAIANLSGWIEEDLGDRLPAENKEQFDLLKNRVLRMEGFIDGLLEYSRIGRSHQSSEIVDVALLLTEVIDSIAPPKQFSIDVEAPMPVFKTKRVPLFQVFSNLINNAIKHHDRQDGRVKISVADQGDCYEFSVADDGPGIDAAYHNKIFTIFQTLRSRDDLESTGIGLSLVEKTIKAEGGSIRINSDEGKGATFIFTWPKEPYVDHFARRGYA
ncbi:PAS fold family [Synechococcus sp. PCC 7335]|uniref:PAS domain-containing sensor histidine kinase n=1 Tax=Synechococcus sp. (strain ATCC 29403 / PCC 7335) TaxID=91464 RepID=UPI00017EBF9D|nr:PAS domain S-box protein [Synechococcus sp. PCC 7335]EDX86439.1 PAS fold family [Synechococcus sp. PCC 7335]